MPAVPAARTPPGDAFWPGCLAGVLLAIHAGLLAWMGYRNSPSIDEIAHLPAGISHWELWRFDLYCVNPPLVRMLAAVPLVWVGAECDWADLKSPPDYRPEFGAGRRFLQLHGARAFWYFTLARWACIPLSLVGGVVCWRWARRLYGAAAGLVALALWCFSPNILANAAMITPDAGAAALGVLAGYRFWRWLKVPNWLNVLLAGAALAAAELAKSTWCVLFGLWVVLWLVWRAAWPAPPAAPNANPAAEPAAMPDASIGGAPSASKSAAVRPSLLQLACILLVGLDGLNLGYLYEGTFTPLGQYQFVSETLGGTGAHVSPGNRFAHGVMANLPVPLPYYYLLGLDIQRRDFEVCKWCYLRGEQKEGGWWYWYLYAFLVKTPLGTWLLVGIALYAAVRCRSGTAGWRDECVLLAPALGVLALVSSQTGFTRYLRYALPIVPFCLIWISQAARVIGPGRRRLVVLTGGALAWSIVSSLLIYPHSLSYFNEAAGGPRQGPAHLLDANIDWGQDLLYLKDWYDAHPEARPFYLRYFGNAEPQAAGIESLAVPALDTAGGSGRRRFDHQPQPGWYAISVNDLYGYRHYGVENDGCAWLRGLTPVATAGYSIYIFHLTADDVKRLAPPVVHN